MDKQQLIQVFKVDGLPYRLSYQTRGNSRVKWKEHKPLLDEMISEGTVSVVSKSVSSILYEYNPAMLKNAVLTNSEFIRSIVGKPFRFKDQYASDDKKFMLAPSLKSGLWTIQVWEPFLSQWRYAANLDAGLTSIKAYSLFLHKLVERILTQDDFVLLPPEEDDQPGS